jgi:ubiquinone/menaquinone biosynthesis C-methylase UbiE
VCSFFAELGAHLYDEGFVNITNIDISAVVINFMTERYSDREEMEFTKMDATNMEFLPNDCFNLIVDKAVLDAQLCGEDNFNNVSMMINEMYRVLKPGGVYVCVSYGVPATRMGYLKTPNLDWTVTNSKLGTSFVRHCVEI